jgi:hypothetical protein
MHFITHVMQAFFEEERRELERKRVKIRLLQQRKTADVTNCKDLPGEIPLQLVIGTKVTARLRRPQDGLFNGSIDAVDTSNNTYRITFERTGLGTHSVPDYEVLVSILIVIVLMAAVILYSCNRISLSLSVGKVIISLF